MDPEDSPSSAVHGHGLPSTQSVFGVLFIVYMISTPLYGVICYQTWQYFAHFSSSDRLAIRLLVSASWYLLIFNSHALYYLLILNNADVRVMKNLVPTLVLPAGTTSLSSCMIHLFFAQKVLAISQGNYILFALLCLLSVAQFAMSLVDMIQGIRFPELSSLPPGYEELIPASFAVTAATNISVTASLVFYLFRGRSEGYRINIAIDRLILFSVNNGFLVSAIAIAILVAKLTFPVPSTALALTFLLDKAQTNMLLSTLNSREKTRKLMKTHNVTIALNNLSEGMVFNSAPHLSRGSVIDVERNATDVCRDSKPRSSIYLTQP